MKQIKSLKFLCLISSFFLLFNCNDDESVVNEPEKVTFSNFTITATSGIDNLLLDWPDVTASNDEVITYDIYIDDTVVIEDLGVSTYTVENLEADKDYKVKVVAKDESGNSTNVEDTFTTSSKPVPTTFAITAKDISHTGFIVNWTAATIDSEQGLTYEVTLDDTIVASDLEVLTYTFTDLDKETAYKVTVTATSKEFETTSTETLEISTSAKPTPTNVAITAKDISYTGFIIDWTAATIDGDQGVTYEVTLNDTIVASDLEVLTYTFTDLDEETAYKITVTATSKEFETTSTETLELTTKEAPKPSTFPIALSNSSPTEFTIEWGGSEIEGNQGVTYDLLLDNNAISSDITTNSNTHTFSDLTAATTYMVTIIAKSVEFGTSITQDLEVTTEEAPKPSTFPIALSNSSPTEFTIEWGGSEIEGNQGVTYDLLLDDNLISSDITTNSNTHTFSDLTAATTYVVTIIAKSAEFGTSITQVLEVTTEEGPKPSSFPIGLSNSTPTGFTIEWGGSEIEGDQGITYDLLLDDTIISSGITSNSNTHTFSGLKASTTYVVTIIAKSVEFGTSITQDMEVTTEEGPKPDDFTLTLDSVGQRSAGISWSSLTVGDDYSVLADIYINGYEESTGYSSSGYFFTGLTPDTDYTVKIIARSITYGTTLEKEITFKTEPLPTTFEVTSAILYGGTTTSPSMHIDFSNRDLLDGGIILNEITYGNYVYSGSNGIIISISEEEYEILSNATTKEGTANYTLDGTSSSKTFTYTVSVD